MSNFLGFVFCFPFVRSGGRVFLVLPSGGCVVRDLFSVEGPLCVVDVDVDGLDEFVSGDLLFDFCGGVLGGLVLGITMFSFRIWMG